MIGRKDGIEHLPLLLVMFALMPQYYERLVEDP